MSKIIFETEDFNLIPSPSLNEFILGIDIDGIPKLKRANDTIILGSIAPSMSYQSVTYTNFLNLVNTSSLVPGSLYLLTDFVTRHYIPYTDSNGDGTGLDEIIYTGSTEPLLIAAMSSSVYNSAVKSLLYPEDSLLWVHTLADRDHEYVNDGYSRGCIIQRVSSQGNKKNYDFRQVRFRRWNDGSGNYTVVVKALAIDPNDYQDYISLTENSNINNFTTYPTPGIYSLDNIITVSSAVEGVEISGYGVNIMGATISHTKIDSIQSTLIQGYFQGNDIGQIVSSTFSGFFAQNKIGVVQNSIFGIAQQNQISFVDNIQITNMIHNQGSTFSNLVLGNLHQNQIDYLDGQSGGINILNNKIDVYKANSLTNDVISNHLHIFQNNSGSGLVQLNNGLEWFNNQFGNNVIGNKINYLTGNVNLGLMMDNVITYFVNNTGGTYSANYGDNFANNTSPLITDNHVQTLTDNLGVTIIGNIGNTIVGNIGTASISNNNVLDISTNQITTAGIIEENQGLSIINNNILNIQGNTVQNIMGNTSSQLIGNIGNLLSNNLGTGTSSVLQNNQVLEISNNIYSLIDSNQGRLIQGNIGGTISNNQVVYLTTNTFTSIVGNEAQSVASNIVVDLTTNKSVNITGNSGNLLKDNMVAYITNNGSFGTISNNQGGIVNFNNCLVISSNQVNVIDSNLNWTFIQDNQGDLIKNNEINTFVGSSIISQNQIGSIQNNQDIATISSNLGQEINSNNYLDQITKNQIGFLEGNFNLRGIKENQGYQVIGLSGSTTGAGPYTGSAAFSATITFVGVDYTSYFNPGDVITTTGVVVGIYSVLSCSLTSSNTYLTVNTPLNSIGSISVTKIADKLYSLEHVREISLKSVLLNKSLKRHTMLSSIEFASLTPTVPMQFSTYSTVSRYLVDLNGHYEEVAKSSGLTWSGPIA